MKKTFFILLVSLGILLPVSFSPSKRLKSDTRLYAFESIKERIPFPLPPRDWDNIPPDTSGNGPTDLPPDVPTPKPPKGGD